MAGHRKFCFPRKTHEEFSLAPTSSPKKPLDGTHFKFEEKTENMYVPDSSDHSLHLTKLLISSYPGETLEGTSREMVRFVFRSHEKTIPNDLCVSIS